MFENMSSWDLWDRWPSAAEAMKRFLSEQVGVLGMGCVAKAWVRGRGGGRGGEGARAFLGALDEEFGRMDGGERVVEEWKGEMTHLRRVVDSW